MYRKPGLLLIMFCVDIIEKKKLENKSIVFNNITYNQEYSIPQIFNKYFTSITEKSKETMPDPPAGKSFSDYLTNISRPNSFYFSPVSSEQIENFILSVENKSSNISTNCTKIIKTIKFL